MMRREFDPTGSSDALAQLVRALEHDDNVRGILILAGDANHWTPADIDPTLTSCTKPVFGGIFPQIIHDRKNHETGTLVIGLTQRPDCTVIPSLSDAHADFTASLIEPADAWAESDPQQQHTLLVFVDGLSRRISAFVESLFSCFGLERNFIGGGAGSLSFEQKPCILTPAGLIEDAALLVRLPMRSGVGVSHGWLPVSDSMKVTESEANVIQSLDWRPAYDVYRELVEEHSGWTFTDDNFFDIAKCYPFGINKLGSEVVVRDPVKATPEKGLICVGEVPKGSFVRLLNGTPESLISAAAQAKTLAEKSSPVPGSQVAGSLFIDCISRVLFLGNRIADELDTAAGTESLFGALTLGEIANNGREYLEFYNKTAVLGLLYETE